jgi:hypothetical protein
VVPARVATVVLLALAVARGARAEVTHPDAIIDRPRTMPAGEYEVFDELARLLMTTVNPSDPGDRVTRRTTSLAIGGAAGITDELDVRIAVPIELRPALSMDQLVSFGAGYTIVRGDAVTAAVRVDGGIEQGGAPISPIQIGIDVQWRIAARVALFADERQLTIGVSGDTRPVRLALPLGVGVQASDRLYLALETRLARFGLHDSGTSYVLVDATPLSGSVYLTCARTVDVFARAAFADLGRAGDSYGLAAGARLFF